MQGFMVASTTRFPTSAQLDWNRASEKDSVFGRYTYSNRFGLFQQLWWALRTEPAPQAWGRQNLFAHSAWSAGPHLHTHV